MLEKQQLQIYLALYLAAKYNSLLDSPCVHTSYKQQNFRCKPCPLPQTYHARHVNIAVHFCVQSSPDRVQVIWLTGFVLSQLKWFISINSECQPCTVVGK